jgi:hypothetical protein
MSKEAPALASKRPSGKHGQPGDRTDSPEYRQFIKLLGEIVYESLMREWEEADLREDEECG